MTLSSVGQAAPGFSLRGIDDKTYDLQKDGARLTLAVFFKTTCPTCMMAWPYIEKLYQAFGRAGLAVWGISQDAREVSAQFASQYGSTFPILIDADWRVSRQYDPVSVPTLVLIDGAGNLCETLVGFDKAGLNRLSEVIAARFNMPAAEIAPPEDGNPVFKPG
jgi:peroxiredoxin